MEPAVEGTSSSCDGAASVNVVGVMMSGGFGFERVGCGGSRRAAAVIEVWDLACSSARKPAGLRYVSGMSRGTASSAGTKLGGDVGERIGE